MMRNIIIIVLILIGCKQQNRYSVNEEDIIKILFIDVGVTTDFVGNTYTLNDWYKQPGIHPLMLSQSEIACVKKKVIESKIFQLPDNVKLYNPNENHRLTEFWIYYKSGRKQHFVYDPSEKSLWENRTFKKIIALERSLGEIVSKHDIDPETKNIHF